MGKNTLTTRLKPRLKKMSLFEKEKEMTARQCVLTSVIFARICNSKFSNIGETPKK